MNLDINTKTKIITALETLNQSIGKEFVNANLSIFKTILITREPNGDYTVSGSVSFTGTSNQYENPSQS